MSSFFHFLTKISIRFSAYSILIGLSTSTSEGMSSLGKLKTLHYPSLRTRSFFHSRDERPKLGKKTRYVSSSVIVPSITGERSTDYHKTTGRTYYLNCRPVNTSTSMENRAATLACARMSGMGMGIHQAATRDCDRTAIATAVIAGERTARDDRFLNKNRQPDRSSRTDTGPRTAPRSVQSGAPIALMYSNVSGSSVYVLTLQIVAAAL